MYVYIYIYIERERDICMFGQGRAVRDMQRWPDHPEGEHDNQYIYY